MNPLRARAAGLARARLRTQLMLSYALLLVINVINLLPVTPLDGGRVLEVLLFARWPLLRLAFAAVSGFILVAAGLFGDSTMLAAPLMACRAWYSGAGLALA